MRPLSSTGQPSAQHELPPVYVPPHRNTHIQVLTTVKILNRRKTPTRGKVKGLILLQVSYFCTGKGPFSPGTYFSLQWSETAGGQAQGHLSSF